jgi:hypothetical protein
MINNLQNLINNSMKIKEIRPEPTLKKSGKDTAIPTEYMKNAWSYINPKKDKYLESKFIPGYRIYFQTEPFRPMKRVFLADPKDLSQPVAQVVLSRYGKGWTAATQVRPKYQGSGLGLKLYEALIKDFNMILVSDSTQSPGGAYLWKRLFKVPGITVYAYNPLAKKSKDKYIQVDSEEDARELETDYGPELYGDTKKVPEKAVIRLIATKS